MINNVPIEAMPALMEQADKARDALLDAYSAIRKAAAIADEFNATALHRDLMGELAAIEDRIEFVSPKVRVTS